MIEIIHLMFISPLTKKKNSTEVLVYQALSLHVFFIVTSIFIVFLCIKVKLRSARERHSAAFTSVSSKERSLQSPSQTLLSFFKWALLASKNSWWLQKIMTNTRWYRISRRRFRTLLLFFDWTIKNGNFKLQVLQLRIGKKNRTFFRFFDKSCNFCQHQAVLPFLH